MLIIVWAHLFIFITFIALSIMVLFWSFLLHLCTDWQVERKFPHQKLPMSWTTSCNVSTSLPWSVWWRMHRQKEQTLPRPWKVFDFDSFPQCLTSHTCLSMLSLALGWDGLFPDSCSLLVVVWFSDQVILIEGIICMWNDHFKLIMWMNVNWNPICLPSLARSVFDFNVSCCLVSCALCHIYSSVATYRRYVRTRYANTCTSQLLLASY